MSLKCCELRQPVLAQAINNNPIPAPRLPTSMSTYQLMAMENNPKRAREEKSSMGRMGWRHLVGKMLYFLRGMGSFAATMLKPLAKKEVVIPAPPSQWDRNFTPSHGKVMNLSDLSSETSWDVASMASMTSMTPSSSPPTIPRQPTPSKGPGHLLTPTLLPQGEDQPHGQPDGEELPPSLLALSSPGPVRLLPMDRQAAPDPSRVPEVQEAPWGDARVIHRCSTRDVPSQQDLTQRNQCIPDPGNLHDVQQGARAPEDRARPQEGEGEDEQEVGEDHLPPEPSTRTISPDRRAGPGDPTVWRSGGGRHLDQSEETMTGMKEKEVGAMTNRRQERLLRQAKAALGETSILWQNLMTCLQSPKVTDTSLWDVFQCTVDSRKLDDWGPCKIRRLANTLGLPKKRAKMAAEVFNPKRFSPRTKKFGLHPGKAFDLELGHDLLQEGSRRTVRQYIKTQKPGLVCVSPPCTLMSMMQNLNKPYRERNPEKQKEFDRHLLQAKLLLRFAIEICQEVHRYGGTFLFEHPWTSKAWQEPCMQDLYNDPRVFLVNGDQCCFQLRSPEGDLHRKPTGWMTNNQTIAYALDRRCDQQHQHRAIEGSYHGVLRSKHAGIYPNTLVDEILQSYRKSLVEKEQNTMEIDNIELYRSADLIKETYDVDMMWNEMDYVEDHECFATGKHQDLPDLPELSHDEPPDQPGGDDEGGPKEGGSKEEEPKALPLEKNMTLERLVRRAHSGLGHIGNERLASILKQAKASPEAVRIAKNLTCPTCQQHKRVDNPRKAAPPRELQPNTVVGVDTVWLPGVEVNGKKKMALNCICWSTRFQLMIPLSNHTPKGAATAFFQWIRVFGPPSRIYCDLGREFKTEFQNMASQNDIYLDPGALEAPTQRSKTERAGKTFKEVLSKTFMETGATTWEEWREAVCVVNATINRLTNKSGYSPMQRMVGRNPRLPGSLLSKGVDDYGSSSRYRVGDRQVQRAMNLRREAAIAYH